MKRKANFLKDWVIEPIAIIVVAFAFTTIVFQPFYVPSGSMQSTLEIGDLVYGNKLAYGYSRFSLTHGGRHLEKRQNRWFGSLPKRGDIAIFALPRDPSQVYVKRVVGLPGDRVRMIGGYLWTNGKPLPLRASGAATAEGLDGGSRTLPHFIETLPGGVEHTVLKDGFGNYLDNTQAFIVPPDHLFMMGDNRDNSLDSRVAPDAGGVGFVPVENLIGRADMILGSYDYLKARGPMTWLSHIRWNRFFRML